jgi:hypothetical protein
MMMCLSKSQDDDIMMMCLSKSQDDDIMTMCLSKSQDDDIMTMCLSKSTPPKRRFWKEEQKMNEDYRSTFQGREYSIWAMTH